MFTYGIEADFQVTTLLLLLLQFDSVCCFCSYYSLLVFRLLQHIMANMMLLLDDFLCVDQYKSAGGSVALEAMNKSLNGVLLLQY
jgi:hypothetical protein